MLLASFLTGTFCVAATGAWYVLRRQFAEEARVMLRMGLYFAAVLLPLQLFFGHLNGDYVHDRQPVKFAAIEGRWHDEQPASEVLLAIPDEANERNRYSLSVPVLGSVIGSMSLNSTEVGLLDFPRTDRPPVAIPFFAFRMMVGCGLLLLAIAWVGTWLGRRGRLEQSRALMWLTFLSFPLPFVAILTGWFTAEVGRQPWAIYGLLRTAQAATPALSEHTVGMSLALAVVTYSFIFTFGSLYIHRLLRVGPTAQLAAPNRNATARRPISVLDEHVARQDLEALAPASPAIPALFKK
jgi:cytochrome d ubiquinol oxidase subunit I